MDFIWCGVVSIFLGGFAFIWVFSNGERRIQFQKPRQAWRMTVLLSMLFALELCVLSNVAVCLWLALMEFGVIAPPAEGTWDVFFGQLVSVAPYMTIAIQLLFVVVGLLVMCGWKGGE
jgi:hypothetical protein